MCEYGAEVFCLDELDVEASIAPSHVARDVFNGRVVGRPAAVGTASCAGAGIKVASLCIPHPPSSLCISLRHRP